MAAAARMRSHARARARASASARARHARVARHSRHARTPHSDVEAADDAAKEPEAVAASHGPLEAARRALAGCALAACVSLAPPASAALPPSLPLSRDPAVASAQRTLVQAWAYARDGFVDAPEEEAWDGELVRAMDAAAGAPGAGGVYDALDGMLASLGDRFTRFERPAVFAESMQELGGGLDGGVGMVLGVDAGKGVGGANYGSGGRGLRRLRASADGVKLRVVASIEGSPAGRSSDVRPNDEVVSIDSVPVAELGGVDGAAARLRGAPGSRVRVVLRRAASREARDAYTAYLPAGGAEVVSELREVKLEREPIKVRSVGGELLRGRDIRGARNVPNVAGGGKVGYVRLIAFTDGSSEELARVLRELADAGARSFVVDLRENSGGLVDVGLDVAGTWLGAGVPAAKIMARDASRQVELTTEAAAISAGVPDAARFTAPLAVLVDEGTASASEILAAALQDAGRATVVGRQTYGKGRIQGVLPLSGGGALFLTEARYVSPVRERPIDGVGIAPDVYCAGSPPQVAALNVAGEDERESAAAVADSCVAAAVRALS